MKCVLLWLEILSWIFAIFVPIVLFIWFLYSRKQRFSQAYYEEIPGIYAGFTDPTYIHKEGKEVYAGIIMNIKTISSQGYFKGDFDYLERANGEVVKDSIIPFYGKLEFKLSRKKKRDVHPLDPNRNRTYKGQVYLVDRHDMPLKIKTIEPYLKCEFTIKHYREMGAIEFTIVKMLKDTKFT